MSSGKPLDQSLAISYDLKRRASKPKKKMANGGYVNDSAKTEQRPMPSEKDQDSKMVAQNSSQKNNAQSDVLDQPTVAQAQRPSRTPLNRPKIANGILKVRDRDDVIKEEMMMSQMPPDGYGKQPDKEYDEQGPDRQGPSSPSLKMKMMAKGGMINEEVSIDQADEDNVQHPAGLESDNDQMKPSDDEIMSNHFAKGGPVDEDMVSRPDKGWGAIIVKDHDDMYAEGGEVQDDMEDSIAAAIMAKRRMMAEGGYINGEDSIYSDDSSQADLSRNAEEDKNMEDQASFDALRKENYSESDGLAQLDSPADSNEHGHELSDEDAHSMISKIRASMAKRQFKAR